jgi:hypothetical protein
MRRNTKRMIAGLAVIGALAGGGTAFTASNTVPASVAGYGTSTISGATVDSLSYTRSADGATITGEALVLSGNQTGRTVEAAFGASNLTACAVGTYDGTSSTPVSCSISVATTAADAFHVAVS